MGLIVCVGFLVVREALAYCAGKDAADVALSEGGVSREGSVADLELYTELAAREELLKLDDR